MQLHKENFSEHNFLWTQWKKLKHFQHLKTTSPEDLYSSALDPTIYKDQTTIEDKEGPNISNSLKVYAKLENNYHLSNKYALFYNMRKYYKALGRDPFEVLPLTFHIK
jgi:hypothetical protein